MYMYIYIYIYNKVVLIRAYCHLMGNKNALADWSIH